MHSSNELSKRVLQLAQQGYSRLKFLEKLSGIIIEFMECDALEIRLADDELPYSWQYDVSCKHKFLKMSFITDSDNVMIPCQPLSNSEERLCRELLQPRYNPELKYRYTKSSIIIQDSYSEEHFNRSGEETLGDLTSYSSLIYCSFITSRDINGLLVLKSLDKDFFTSDNRIKYENLATSLGIAIAFQRSQYALRERVKELTCLHSMNKLLQANNLELDVISQKLVNMVPGSFQYPEHTSCCLKLENGVFQSHNFRDSSMSITHDIYVQDDKAGELTVFLDDEDDLEFLHEEYDLVQSIAGTCGAILRKLQHEEEKKIVQEQLRHADRLATIGQLAAGIAHELNEPLANILGYSELMQQDMGTENPDLQKIVNSSLYARDVVRKLLIFARQMPTHMKKENLNEVISDSMLILESRLRKSDINLKLSLEKELPPVTADFSQMKQVIINLVVNSEQAITNDGEIEIKTFSRAGSVYLEISDNGIGISQKLLKKIFLPFFTTKQAGDGTGLGLSVVYGIINSHGGKIEVSSELEKGTTFTVSLPCKTTLRNES